MSSWENCYSEDFTGVFMPNFRSKHLNATVRKQPQTCSLLTNFNNEQLRTPSLKMLILSASLIFSFFYLFLLFLRPIDVQKPKALCQKKKKESLCEPEAAFILQARTKSDASRRVADTGSDHGGSIFTAPTFLSLLDVWWRRVIKVIEKATNVRIFF